MKTNEVILHGEAMIIAIDRIPAHSKEVAVADKAYIVCPSETTGNHHVIDMVDGIKIFENDKNVRFMESDVATVVRCVVANRHTEISIPPGSYEFGTQQEYDPFTKRLEKVRD